MKNISNRKDLPEIIVNAVRNDPYDAGKKTDYSATQLIRPSYQVALQQQHQEDIVEDAADMLWAMYGTAVHYIIERGAGPNDLVEERLYGEISGVTISAQLDHYGRDTQRISDWKLTSAYKVKKAIVEQDFDDWEQQLNIQAWLAKINGYEVSELFIGAMIRDWRPSDKAKDPKYPDQIEYIQIPMWTFEEQEEFVAQRIAAMLSPQPCSPEERWQGDTKYALIKEGATRALKVSDDHNDLLVWCLEKGHIDDHGNWANQKLSIETREGPNRRCEGYCNVAQFCDYYRENYLPSEELPFK